MEFASGLGRRARIYAWTVVGLGFLAIGESLAHLYRVPIGSQWFLLAFLTLVSGSASVYLPWANISISISEAFTFTAVLLYGPEAGTLTVALDGLVISFWVARRRPEIDRALFNIAAPALSAWMSSRLFFYLSAIPPLADLPADQATRWDRILPALVVFAVSYFILNSWLIACIVALKKHVSIWTTWRTGFVWLSLNYFCGASVAILLVGYNRVIDLRFVGVIVPLLLVLYFTFKTSTDRVTDANRHVDHINTLYLSTIETLAMAIDAKDQITHGHIRRVQAYAIGLAKKVGVSDDKLIKAIEAAALLHDMGKLAVPEYILNKPGKLTDAEFEKMKLHASVGADILSAIDFPYPVVPIVRHHHENWNGKGYPDGLHGTDIPIGARILSVVDCFDALTSDRPYRPRLPDSEAIRILIERRGTMYDPLIVDTFIRVHTEIARDIGKLLPDRSTLGDLTTSGNTVEAPARSRLEDISASADETATLHELSRSVLDKDTFAEKLEVISGHLRRLVPFSLWILFTYDATRDELVGEHSVGEIATQVKGLRIVLGQRLSGWVAAARQTIVNSDPVLDLGEIARTSTPRLRSCISTPLLAGKDLIGVLTLYSPTPDCFTDDHRRQLEIFARHTADMMGRPHDGLTPGRRDALDKLGHSRISDEGLLKKSERDQEHFKAAALFVEVEGSTGRQTQNDVDRHVVDRIRLHLRPSDLIFLLSGNEVVILLPETDFASAQHLAVHIRDVVSAEVAARIGSPCQLSVAISMVASSLDDRFGSKLADYKRQAISVKESIPKSERVH